jgi:hypothetical protein
MSRKIPQTGPGGAGPGGDAADAAALDAERLRNMNSLQWLGLQAELALERGLDLCAPGGDAHAARAARAAWVGRARVRARSCDARQRAEVARAASRGSPGRRASRAAAGC